MCGVVAYFSPSEPRERLFIEALLKQGVEALHRRGPDGKWIWVSPECKAGLGHTRLAVVGATQNDHIIRSEDGNLVLSFNGELYGDRDLRSFLESKGHRFATDYDSEVAVHLYEEYGLEFLSYLRGEFAFVLWDSRVKRLIAVRDRFGVKPLVWSWDGSSLWVASKAKALFAMGVPCEWDGKAFLFAATMQYPPVGSTLFSGINSLPPGCLLRADIDGLKVERWFDLTEVSGSISQSLVEGTEQNCELAYRFGELLSECVEIRLRGNSKVAFHLSGGIDSTAVVGLAKQHLTYVPTCFAIAFESPDTDPLWNERSKAQEVALRLGVDLHVVSVSPENLAQALGPAVRSSEGLAVNGHLSAKYILNRFVNEQGFKVVLTGEGADEVLFGYPHFKLDLEVAVAEKIYRENRVCAGIMVTADSGWELDEFTLLQQRWGFIPAFLKAKAALGKKLYKFLDPDLRAEARLSWQKLTDTFECGRAKGVYFSRLLWNMLALSGYILPVLGDGMEMAHSVEGRLPFLDHHLYRFLSVVPVSSLYEGGMEKALLRRSMEFRFGRIGTDFIWRPKHPFMAPPLGRYVKKLLWDFPEDSVPFFSRREVRKVLSSSALDENPEWDPPLIWAACAIHLGMAMRDGLWE